MMIKKIALFSILFSFTVSLWAGPFIQINSTDAASDYPYIQLRVSVQDKDKNWITGLDEENFLVYEDGYRVNYVQVKNLEKDKELLYLVFSIDSSKSIPEDYFEKIKKSAIDIVIASGVLERIAVFRFNNKVVLLKNFTDNKASLVEEIQKIEQSGTNTVLYDAIYDSIDLISRVEGNRKAVVIFTDGKNEGSSITSEDITSFANANGIPLFIVSFAKAENIKKLRRLSKLTGGQCLEVDSIKNVPAAYQKIIRNIKSQYLIRYHSMVKQDGKTHLAEVRLKHGEIRDRDIQKFSVNQELIKIDFPHLKQILLVVIAGLFIVVFFFLIFFLIKRSRNNFKQRKNLNNKRSFYNSYDTENPVYQKSTDVLKENDLYPVGYSNEDRETIKPVKQEYYANAWLLLQDGRENKKFVLSRDEVVIGSGDECQIIIRSQGVSKKHSCVKKIDGNYFLFDMVSDSGTYLNGTKLLRPKELHDWDEIVAGPVTFIFRGSRF
ncbi:MAG: VWA domain-containing protein [Spirochaetes bacterium]|nr:VWA domain-containing protein [Spirochaetota bacterium]MBN2771151.1 VWA domain-containing protein [Spirochaetota bacterium]